MWRDIATVAAVLVAVITLIKVLVEYVNQGKLKRCEHFLLIRKRFNEDASLRRICDLLEGDSKELKVVPYNDKRNFLGFYEEIAIMLNSKIIRKRIAHYMFGYYAILCWESKNFWEGDGDCINRETPYWAVFKDFVTQMEEIQGSLGTEEATLLRKNYRL